MKSEKSSLKKAVKVAAKTIRERTVAVAAKLKKAKTVPASEPPAATPIAAKTGEKATTRPTASKTGKKSAAKKEVPPVPAILLEGDQPAAPVATGPGQRYALGPVPPPEHLGGAESAGELPEAYGTQQLLLTARDPHWLYARWDLTREQQRKYNRLSADGHLVLQIFVDAVKGAPCSQIHVHPESNHWFVPVTLAGAKYFGVIGYYLANGKWTAISTSDATLTPPDAMSEDTSAQFATIPIEVPFAQLMELARLAVRENIPLVEVLQQLRASGYNIPEGHAGKWTPEQERALASIISMDRVRRIWMGSVEITELIRRRLQQEISSIAVAQFSLPSSPVGGISSFSSLSSPFGGREHKKGFWFNVNAELILYGATEPDAEVTIGGRSIKLRPDGTFSFRFALPDGQYELPAVAVSADKTDGRAAELKFGRSTEYRGEVGVCIRRTRASRPRSPRTWPDAPMDPEAELPPGFNKDPRDQGSDPDPYYRLALTLVCLVAAGFLVVGGMNLAAYWLKCRHDHHPLKLGHFLLLSIPLVIGLLMLIKSSALAQRLAQLFED